MLFWFFSDGWKSTLPTIGRARFQSSEEHASSHRKSTLPLIGRARFRSSEMIYSISGLSLPPTVST